MRFPTTCLVLLVWAVLALASPLQASFSSCESYYNLASAQLDVSDVYAAIVPKARAAELGLAGGGSQDVLRLNVFGSATDTIVGYSNDTNKLGASDPLAIGSAHM